MLECLRDVGFVSEQVSQQKEDGDTLEYFVRLEPGDDDVRVAPDLPAECEVMMMKYTNAMPVGFLEAALPLVATMPTYSRSTSSSKFWTSSLPEAC